GGVGDRRAGDHRGELGEHPHPVGAAKHGPLVGTALEHPRAVHHVGVPLEDRAHQLGQLQRVVLPVGIARGTTAAPRRRATWYPSDTAAPCPRRRSRPTTSAPCSRATSSVASTEPSDTTITSVSRSWTFFGISPSTAGSDVS